MDMAELGALLKNSPPIVVVVIGLIVMLNAVLNYFDRRSAKREDSLLRKQVEDTHTLALTHNAKADMVATKSLEVFENISHQLTVLSSTMSGQVMALPDAKSTIRYQWSWCRDETARLIINSIHNNKFKGREAVVARIVQRAWAAAAYRAKESLDALKTLKYPYQILFEKHINILWHDVWDAAVPLYHRDIPNGMGNLADALEGLRDMVVTSFDLLLEEYFTMSEDVENGSVYGAHVREVGNTTRYMRSTSEMSYATELEHQTEAMTAALVNYKKGGSPSGNDHGRSAVKTAMLRQLETERIRQDDAVPTDPDEMASDNALYPTEG